MKLRSVSTLIHQMIIMSWSQSRMQAAYWDEDRNEVPLAIRSWPLHQKDSIQRAYQVCTLKSHWILPSDHKELLTDLWKYVRAYWARRVASKTWWVQMWQRVKILNYKYLFIQFNAHTEAQIMDHLARSEHQLVTKLAWPTTNFLVAIPMSFKSVYSAMFWNQNWFAIQWLWDTKHLALAASSTLLKITTSE